MRRQVVDRPPFDRQDVERAAREIARVGKLPGIVGVLHDACATAGIDSVYEEPGLQSVPSATATPARTISRDSVTSRRGAPAGAAGPCGATEAVARGHDAARRELAVAAIGLLQLRRAAVQAMGLGRADHRPVDDVALGHLRAMERGRLGERYILGSQNLRLREIFELLGEHRISAAPVVDDDGRLVGVVTRKDILRAVRAGLAGG